jgi:hypothetical protein
LIYFNSAYGHWRFAQVDARRTLFQTVTYRWHLISTMALIEPTDLSERERLCLAAAKWAT